MINENSVRNGASFVGNGTGCSTRKLERLFGTLSFRPRGQNRLQMYAYFPYLFPFCLIFRTFKRKKAVEDGCYLMYFPLPIGVPNVILQGIF